MTQPENFKQGLLPALYKGSASIEVGGERLAGEELAAAAGGVARTVAGARRVAIVAHPKASTIAAIAGILAAGAAAVPLHPASGPRERDHILGETAPDLVLDEIDPRIRGPLPPEPAADENAAFILYTSGSTGRPKGAVLSRRAIAENLDALAGLWEWTAEDVLAHSLPLFHVHGLVFGCVGPLRIGSPLVHTGFYFRPVPGATLYFGVPALWGSLSPRDLAGMRGARLLASGAGPLPQRVFDRIEEHCGLAPLNRYAMTETLIITSPSPRENRTAQSVGRPLPGVSVRLAQLEEPAAGPGEIGVVQVRGPGLFSGYLGHDPVIDTDGWFSTGDVGQWQEDGSLRLLGRKDTDLIKTGGYRVGAGEVEEMLLSHPAIAEAAVGAVPDNKLGHHIAAWVVTRGPVDRSEINSHLATGLAPYKRPLEIHIVKTLPRNALGKLQKHRLLSWSPQDPNTKEKP